MELNIEPLIYETELLIKDILTTEATEAGSLGARRTHAPKMNEVNRREVAQNAKRSSARAATRRSGRKEPRRVGKVAFG